MCVAERIKSADGRILGKLGHSEKGDICVHQSAGNKDQEVFISNGDIS